MSMSFNSAYDKYRTNGTDPNYNDCNWSEEKLYNT